jgi:hypothetical protein
MRRILASLALCVALLACGAARASQNTWVTPGAPLPMTSLASFLNSAYQAVGTFNSGTTSPTVGPASAPIANMAWWNTNANPNVLEFYDGASWVSTGMSLNTSTHSWTFASPSITTVATISNNGIGGTSTDGAVLQNTTAAANGAQQWSPRLHFIGQGWKSNATAASQTADWIVENQTIQGTAAPFARLIFSYQINGAGYTPAMAIGIAGDCATLVVGAPSSGCNAGTSLGDLVVGRATNQGFVFLGTSLPAYVGYDGTKYTFGGSPLPINAGGTAAGTQQAALNNIAPTPTRAGDLIYWNGSNWVNFAGNNSGTLTLQENASGVPSWASVAGTGTVTSAVIAASGGAATSGTCTITTSGTCTIAAPGGFLNVLRNASFAAWFHGTSVTATTAGAWCTEGVLVLPTGASAACTQAVSQSNTAPYYSLKVTGAASITDLILRYVVESNQSAQLSASTVTFQIYWFNNTGGSVTPTIQTKYANNGAVDNWGAVATDLAATNLQACGSGVACHSAYTLTVSNNAVFGYEFNIDFGNNFSTNGKNIVLLGFDARVTPGVATGLNANPPPLEIRDMESDIRWSERFYQTTYDNGVAPGTATHVGMVGTSGTAATNVGEMGNVFRTTMRCDPTVSFWDGAGTANKLSFWNSSSWTDGNNANSPAVIPGSAGHRGFVFYNNNNVNFSFHYAADCTVSGG